MGAFDLVGILLRYHTILTATHHLGNQLNLAGKVDQDWDQSGSACQARNLPDSEGCGAMSAIPSDPGTDKTTRCAVAEDSADMTAANCLPVQPTTRGRRCRCVLTPPETTRSDIQTALFCHDLSLRAPSERKPACGASNSTGRCYPGTQMARRRSWRSLSGGNVGLYHLSAIYVSSAQVDKLTSAV